MFRILLSALFFSSQVFAGLPPTTSKGQSDTAKPTTFNFQVPNFQSTQTAAATALLETGNGNLLINPSFENSVVNTGWIRTGTVVGDTTTNVATAGKKAIKITYAGTVGGLLYQSVNLTGFVGGNFEGFQRIKINGTATDLKFCIIDTDSSVRLSCIDILQDNAWHDYQINYPGFATIGMAIYSSTGLGGDLYADDSYLGPARNIGTVAQAYYFGGITQNGAVGCTYIETTSSGPANFITLPDGSGCAAWITKPGGAGSVAPVATNSQGIVLSGVAPGVYNIKVKAGFNSSSSSSICNWRLFDGTTGYDAQFSYNSATTIVVPLLDFTIPVSSTLSTLTLRLQASGGSGGNCSLDNTASGRNAVFEVFYFPSQSQQAVRMDTAADLMGTTFYSGKSTCPANSLPADGAAVSRSIYTGLFQNIGTTFGVGDGSTTFNVPDMRGVFVRGAGSQTIGGITYSGTLATKQGDQMQGHIHTYNNPTYTNDYTAGLNRVGTLGTSSGNSGNPASDGTNGTPRTGTQTQPANISMTPCIWTVSQNAPLIVGGVTSSSAGTERVERVSFGGSTNPSNCTSSPCTIYSSTPGVTSVTRSGTGSYLVNFAAGLFSGIPACTCIGTTTSDDGICAGTTNGSATSKNIFVRSSTAAARADGAMDVICMGPR